MNEFVEAIEYDGEVLAYLIKSQWMPDKTEFVDSGPYCASSGHDRIYCW